MHNQLWCEKALNRWQGPDIAVTVSIQISILAMEWNTGPLWVLVDIITTIHSIIYIVLVLSSCLPPPPTPHLSTLAQN